LGKIKTRGIKRKVFNGSFAREKFNAWEITPSRKGRKLPWPKGLVPKVVPLVSTKGIPGKKGPGKPKGPSQAEG